MRTNKVYILFNVDYVNEFKQFEGNTNPQTQEINGPKGNIKVDCR